MSRIGLKPIDIPSGVEIKLDDKNHMEVKGPKGVIQEQLSPDMEIKIEENQILVNRPTENKRHKSLHGLTRTLIANMIEGVTNGYTKKLEIQGTGYRAQKQGNKLVLNLGYSHPVELEDPEGIEVEVPAANQIVVKGINKQQVGNYAAVIRDLENQNLIKVKELDTLTNS